MVYFKKILLILSIAVIFVGCGSSSTTEKISQDENASPSDKQTDKPLQTPLGEEQIFPEVYLEMPKSDPCEDGEFYRLKTKECMKLEHASSGFQGWGFQGFTVGENNYTISSLTEGELKDVISNLPKEGGTITIPEGTIEIIDGITIPGNVILQGVGAGKSILSNRSSGKATSVVELDGENIIVRGLTVEGNGESLNGIDGHKSGRNILIEFIEARNFKLDQGSGISFSRGIALYNSRITIRYNNLYNSLHGIGMKIRTDAKMLIYSNQAFNNANYGIDISTTSSVEVAGNHLHNNEVAGAKTPNSNRIIYHHNDVNYNKTAGLVYAGKRNYYASITVKYNNLSYNGGEAFACWDATLFNLYLIDNIVIDSKDANGYTIGAYGARNIYLTGDHGEIWYNAGNSKIIPRD